MINFLRQLLKLWFVLMICAFAAYLLIFNQDPVQVNLPGITSVRVVSAVAYLISFALGATLVATYFATDMLRKSWEIRALRRKISRLEADLMAGGIPVSGKKKSWFKSKEPPITATSLPPVHVPRVED